MTEDVVNILLGFLQGATATAVFLLVLFVGFCVVFGFLKFRATGRNSLTVKSLDEMLGQRAEYLSPNAPRGRADQLRTPELLEKAAKKPA